MCDRSHKPLAERHNGVAVFFAFNPEALIIVVHRRAAPLPLDADFYKWRHLIENCFCKLKEFKPTAMRADKTDQSFAAMIYLVAAVIDSR